MLLFLLLGCGEEEAAKDETCELQLFYLDSDGDGFGDPFVEQSACTAPEGHVDNYLDCDDTDETENPDAYWYRDADGDGYGDAEQGLTACSQPIGYTLGDGDCDDSDSTRHPDAQWYLDEDQDGYGSEDKPVDSCDGDELSVSNSDDCDDADWLRHPAANEVCDGVDNDCDGAVDDDDPNLDTYTQSPMFEDIDQDGYGTDVLLGYACPSSTDGATVQGDCDDGNPVVHPGQFDYADSLDQDCDGEAHYYNVGYVEEGWIGDVSGASYGSMPLEAKDIDGDGLNELIVSAHAYEENVGGIRIIPGAVGDRSEFPSEGIIWNGEADEDKAGTSSAWCGDMDGDGVEDILVSAPWHGEGDDGKIYLLSADAPGGSLADASAYVFTGETATFGFDILGLGDIDEDGLAEALVAAPRDDNEGNNRGSLNIVQVSDAGDLEISLSIYGTRNGDNLGYSMSMGDVNGDGLSDLLVGAPYSDEPENAAGSVCIVPVSDLVSSGSIEEEICFTGVQEREHAGFFVTIPGDTDGDGYDDMLAGAPDRDVDTEDEGAAYLVMGQGEWWTEGGSLADSPLVLIGTGEGGSLGQFMGGIGDIDGDSATDFIVTAHAADLDLYGEGWVNTGSAYGFLGGEHSGTLDLAISSPSFHFVGESNSDQLGRGIAPAGDMDADGYDDFWLTAPFAGSNGSLYLLHGIPAPGG